MNAHARRQHRFRGHLGLGLLLVLAPIACKANAPTSPNMPASLDGQNTNEAPTFNGSITVFGGGTAPADGVTDVAMVVEVRDRQGNPAQNFTPVGFSTSLGTVRAPGTDPTTAGSAVQVTTFGGQAQVLLRSEISGTARVTAWIADVASTALVEFEAGPSTDIIALSFREGGTDTTTVTGVSPFLVPVVAAVTDEDAAPLSGKTVRFRIVANSAQAMLTGSNKSLTDAAGEATNVLRANTIGTVSLEADLLDDDGNVVGQSNQIVATITNASDQYQVSLTFADGSTFATAAPGATTGLLCEVVDHETEETLSGVKVRFRIVSDTAQADVAKLAATGTSLTDGDGVASNAVTAYELDTRVVLVVDVLDASGRLLSASNQVVLSVAEDTGGGGGGGGD